MTNICTPSKISIAAISTPGCITFHATTAASRISGKVIIAKIVFCAIIASLRVDLMTRPKTPSDSMNDPVGL